MALQGFGGVLPVAERVLVHERKWLTSKEFVEMFAIAQTLPGPNVVNLSLMVGDRFLKLRGAFAALAGMLCFPMAIVLALTSLYQAYAAHPFAQRVLLGMAAVSVGMIAGMAVRLAKTQAGFRLGWVIGAAAFIAVALIHVRVGVVILVLGATSFAVRWWQLIRDANIKRDLSKP